jgi:Na+-translocating ferredoxin:NAD+ oxidoreductase RnfD subunit
MRIPASLPFLTRYLLDAEARQFWLRNGFRLLAVTLAGLHAWTAARSHSMNPDGVAYLDIGDAYFRGDWEVAISTVWSPLYAWILGAVMWLVEPSMRWEFPLVHLVNFFIFCWRWLPLSLCGGS